MQRPAICRALPCICTKKQQAPEGACCKFVQIKSLDRGPALGDRVLGVDNDVLDQAAANVRQGGDVDIPGVVMTIGGFLHGSVVPGASLDVGPGLHLAGDIGEAVGVRTAADEVVGDLNGFCAGQELIRVGVAVFIAGEDAQLVEQGDVVAGPVTVQILEDAAGDGSAALDVEQLCNDGAVLGAGDRSGRVEVAVVVADDEAGFGAQADLLIGPVALRNVGEGLAAGLLGEVGLGLVGHEVDDDLADLITTDAAVRAEGAVRIAVHVSKVIRGVQADLESGPNGDNVHIGQLANGPVGSDGGLVVDAGRGIGPGSAGGVNMESAVLGEDSSAISSGLGLDDVVVLVIDRDLSALRGTAQRGLDDDNIVREIVEEVLNDIANNALDFGRLRQGSSVFHFCDVFIGSKSHDRQQADDHNQSEKHAEQFAGLFHCFHSFDKCT